MATKAGQCPRTGDVSEKGVGRRLGLGCLGRSEFLQHRRLLVRKWESRCRSWKGSWMRWPLRVLLQQEAVNQSGPQSRLQMDWGLP